MKYVDEYRDAALGRGLARAIVAAVRPETRYNLMEFCGGHTHAIARHGLEDLLPGSVRLIHGPGCPVCVLPVGRLDMAIALVREHGVILCTYGDMMRVPGSGGTSLLQVKAEGGDVRMVYSTLDAVAVAQAHPDRAVVFFAIGFETTTPPTAMAVTRAEALDLRNFSVFCNHVLTPAAIQSLLDSPDVRDLDGGSVPLDGFIGPAHVSTVIGARPYAFFAEEYRKPVVITGFEPLDVLQAVLMLVRQINDGRAEVEVQYARAVTRRGNEKAQALVAGMFDLRKVFAWRGLGPVPYSALTFNTRYATWDAERRFALPDAAGRDPRGCDCGAILRGVKEPRDCRLFGTACTPEKPVGACMVSSEGACAAYWTHGRFRDARHGEDRQCADHSPTP
ncbi:hydrogenase formation protein HypD [Roseospira visakhapatnamensis]|uniref:Hydrogenase maturation factor n=1 Tax=Roseospira visakhapatnamensis TaxID=390880 RepID=A0A7W6RFJ5_9PROT|nr:hydrogenase formation protein HypD [Roseospira visakhapatnamensis]MBB4267106.1 hydrogenase expression/formation protein HypD [Roseospira visakhapatnamensis]